MIIFTQIRRHWCQVATYISTCARRLRMRTKKRNQNLENLRDINRSSIILLSSNVDDDSGNYSYYY